jgi:hypothetical protein
MINEILNDSAKLIFVALCFVMLLELIMAFVFFNIIKQFIANSRTVKAKIKKLEDSGNGTKAYISLKDPLGKMVDTTIMVPLNKYKENEEIEVLSNKDNPTEVKFNSFLSLWFLPGAMFQGVIMVGIVLGIMVSMDIAKLPF